MGTEETGVKLVATNESQFTSTMARGQAAVSSFVGAVNGGVTQLTGFNLANLTIANTVGNLVSTAIQKATGAIVDMGKEAVLSAARFQEMTTVDEFLGNRMGYTTKQVDDQIASIRKYGIEAGTAADLVANFARYNLDMTKATNLARVAQDAAVISNQNSSEALQGLLWGIVTYNQRVLRTYGINLDMSKAEEVYAKSIGKTTDALTEEDKVTAALNGVLSKGAAIAGVYQTAMETPGKQLTSMPRIFDDLAVAVGTPLLGAFGSGLKAVQDFVKELTVDFSQGGSLYPSLVTFGNNLNDLVVNLTGLGRAGETAGQELASSLGITFDNLNSKGFAWGYNIINQVVSGMLQGVIDSVGVMTTIGDWLGSWFEAHSPPKILPDLDKWGAAAMQSYLDGWKAADFSVFDEIAGIVERSLRAQAGTKDTGLIPSIIGSRNAIAQAVDSVREAGAVTDAILNRLYATVGAGNPQMQEYLKTTLELAVANDKVSKAQTDLNAITKKYDDLLAPLNAQVNALQNQEDNSDAAGRISQLQLVLTDVNATAADKERARVEIQKLQAQTQIRNIQQQKDAETAAAQKKLDEAKAQQEAIAAQQEAAKAQIQAMTQQNDLVRQQVQLLEQLAKAAERLAKAAGGAIGGGVTPGGGIKPPTMPGHQQGLYAESVLPKPNAFQPIIDKMNELAGAGDKLSKAWAPVGEALKPVGDFFDKHGETIARVVTILGIMWVVGTAIAKVWAVVATVLGVVGTVIGIIVAPEVAGFLAVALAVAIVATLIITHWEPIKKFFIGIWQSILKGWEDFKVNWNKSVDQWNQTWAENGQRLKDSWDQTCKDITQFASNAWENIKKAWNGAPAWFQTTVLDNISKGFNTALYGEDGKSGIVGAFSKAWDAIKKSGTSAVNSIIDALNKMISGAVSGINSLIKALNSVGKSIPGWSNIGTLTVPVIPKLAKGAVIPSGESFLAILGDQLSGRNLEAPEGLIRQIVGEEFRQSLFALASGRVSMPAGASMGGSSITNVNHTEYHMPIYTNNSPAALQQSAGLMRILAS